MAETIFVEFGTIENLVSKIYGEKFMEDRFRKLIDEINSFYNSSIISSEVHNVSPKEIRDKLKKYNFDKKVPFDELFEDIIEMNKRWCMNVTSPKYLGLFNPSVSEQSIIADTLTALYNPQLAVWKHAPFANEIERHTLKFFGKFIFSNEDFFSSFTTGGSEANMTGILAALGYTFPDFCKDGVLFLKGKPRIYVSEFAHHSFEKIAKNVGIGENAVCRIPVNQTYKLNTDLLHQQIESDKNNGHIPFLVVGTAGTTSLGTVDELEKLVLVCREQKLWFHVDAAWGGAAVISPKLKPILEGIEQADSITIDAHKWLSVSMGAGMFFTKHKNIIKNIFSVKADYMPQSTDDVNEPYITSIQWSRRFIGLKLFMTLAEEGIDNIIKRIEHQYEMGNYLREQLIKRNWIIVNPTDLPVICFTHSKIISNKVTTKIILEAIYQKGGFWLSDVHYSEKDLGLRACITSFKTTRSDIDFIVKELENIINNPVN